MQDYWYLIFTCIVLSLLKVLVGRAALGPLDLYMEPRDPDYIGIPIGAAILLSAPGIIASLSQELGYLQLAIFALAPAVSHAPPHYHSVIRMRYSSSVVMSDEVLK